MSHERNVEGLKTSAGKRRQETLRRTEEAIRLLLAQKRPVNFQSVAQTASVSAAWLYREQAVRERIEHLRGTTARPVELRRKTAATDASKDAIIEALQVRIRRQDEEIRELRKQLEVSYGRLYEAESPVDNGERKLP